MASEPSWSQNHDRNGSQSSEFDSFLNSGTSAWIREGGERGPSATQSLGLNGVHHDSDAESKADQFSGNGQKMDTNAPSEPASSAGERSRAPRPLKSRPEDRINSITDNPFYKSFGVRHPRSSRDVPCMTPGAKMTVDADGKFGLREDLGDYKPGSGFVHKLMGRFASLGVREEPPSLHHIKHASSFDDIVDGPEAQVESDTRHRDRGRPMASNMQHRARSVDALSRRRAPPSLPVALRHIERKWESPAVPAKSTRDTHIVAPDVKLARDDIILIENPPSEPPSHENNIDDGGDNENAGINVTSFKGDMLTDELPKPNTVSTVRSLFESCKPMSPTSLNTGEPFSGYNDQPYTPRDSVVTPRDSGSTPRDGGLTPRETVLTPTPTPRESNSTPRDSVLTPRDSNLTPREPRTSQPPSPRVHTDFSQRYDASKSRFSWSSDFKPAGSVDSSSSAAPSYPPPPLPSSFPSVSTTTAAASTAEAKAMETDTSENVKPSLINASGGAENRMPPSPRSTAAVKAIPASRPLIPSRPTRPASTSLSSSSTVVPPSFTPSIKKTSPVMPVAPFKENNSEEGDENRHLIYAKRSASSRPKRPERVKQYEEVSSGADTTKSLQEEVTKADNQNDVQKANKVNNRAHAKGRAPPVPRQRQSEESPIQSPRPMETSENQWTDVLKPLSPRIEDSEPERVTLTPVEQPKPAKAPRSFFTKPEQKTSAELEVSRSVSPPQSEETKMDTLDVTAEDSKADTDAPIRGIPTIIANRMKQNSQNQSQNTDAGQTGLPGELFGVRLGKTRHGEDPADEAEEIPRKRLHPAPEKTEKDPAVSEIENQIASVRRKMEHQKKKNQSGVSKVFDSSQLKKKPKDQSRANPGVPRLDLSGITADESGDAGRVGGYRVTPRDIKPCNIEVVGGNVSVGRNLLVKQRKAKINIRFHEVLVETFEYPSEETVLDNWMKQHPNDVLVLEEVVYPAESSDDPDILDTPRGGGGGLESELRSNTSLAHSGNLQSYRGKYQQEYELGAILTQPEKPSEPQREPEPVDPDSMQLRPADEDDTQTWSNDTSSDLLF
ncbi:proteoglycan 4-like [Littorina saxatilis]|uniref:Uncharacterized protein n=1 Tax=Littorina saxatilis TaxID=31220 RepID=A0AAN9G4V9_9CAEN